MQRTATTQAVGAQPGNVFGQGKYLPKIAMAHDIPYVATATIAALFGMECEVFMFLAIQNVLIVKP